jgi:hypothetical protein
MLAVAAEMTFSSALHRSFMKELLPVMKEVNPQLAIEEVVRKGRHPQAVALYREFNW